MTAPEPSEVRLTEDEREHRLIGEIGRQACTCGWEAPLGAIVWRAFDKHLLDIRASHELGGAAKVTATESALAALRALLDAEIAETIESRVRTARADVRCLDCNLRYEERQEYGCHESGRAHSYDDGDLAGAEEIERGEPVEYVTLSVAALRAALATTSEEAER